jgi:hypothetical protein
VRTLAATFAAYRAAVTGQPAAVERS